MEEQLTFGAGIKGGRRCFRTFLLFSTTVTSIMGALWRFAFINRWYINWKLLMRKVWQRSWTSSFHNSTGCNGPPEGSRLSWNIVVWGEVLWHHHQMMLMVCWWPWQLSIFFKRHIVLDVLGIGIWFPRPHHCSREIKPLWKITKWQSLGAFLLSCSSSSSHGCSWNWSPNMTLANANRLTVAPWRHR